MRFADLNVGDRFRFNESQRAQYVKVGPDHYTLVGHPFRRIAPRQVVVVRLSTIRVGGDGATSDRR